MKQDIEKNYLIDRFLKGELSGNALDEFKNRMKVNPEFAEEVWSQKAIIEGIKLARRNQLLAVLKGDKLPSVVPVSISSEPTPSPIESSIEKTELPFSANKLKPKINNWYFAAAAVLFTGLFLYFVFGYYLPRQNGSYSHIDSSSNDSKKGNQNNVNIDEPEDSIDLAYNPYKNDTAKLKLPKDDIATEIKPKTPEPGDSIKIEKDRKKAESLFSVSSLELIKPEDVPPKDPNVSNDNTSPDLKVGEVRKVKSSTVKVEYWQSVVNFKGYKLNGSNLQLFDVSPEEGVSLKFLDKHLYMKKNGSYYKLNPSGSFETYQKESNPEIIKLLETN